MISEKYADMTTKGSIIREFAQYASKRAAEIGKENVYNFTIGNPSVPVCPEFTETLERMLKEENPLFLVNIKSMDKKDLRAYGSNAARLIKGIPFKEV